MTVTLTVLLVIGGTKVSGVSAENSDMTDAESISENTETKETEDKSQTNSSEENSEQIVSEEAENTSEVDGSTEKVKTVETVQYAYEDDEVNIKVTAPLDALPDDAELNATKLDDTTAEELGSDTESESVAYDVFFKKDGIEIEPTQSVEVEMSLKLDDADSVDLTSVNVQHIKDDSEVSTVLEKSENNEAVNSEGNTLNTTFTTDSFSYFVINYNNNYKIYAHLIDTEGTEFPASASDQLTVTGQYDQANFYNWNRKENIWVEVKTLVATYGEFTNGYTYQSTHVGSADGTEMKWIYYSTSRSWTSGKKANTWYYSTSDTMPTDTPTSSTPTLTENSSIYCIYTKDYESDAEIQDNVHADGSLFLARPSGISDTANVTYKWYRSTEKNGTYEYAKRQKVTGGNYTVISDSTGTRLYPALDVAITDEYLADQSVRFWYKVEVYVDGELYETTGSVQNQYYASLQNGSFENIDTQLLNNGQSASFVPEGTTGLAWKTTGTDHQVEVVYGPNASSSYNVSSAPDGNQFAELNAEAQGALYQDIMSTPDTGLYWKLYHRGRTGTDTMYLIVAPTSLVEDITTQSQLSSLASAILADPDGYAEKGYYIQTITDSTSSWGEYSGTYDVPDGVYLTRLFFVSASNSTVGNFIDAVAFSSLMPEPDSGYANLTVSKTVTGILDTDIKNYKVKVDVTNTKDGTTYSKTLDFSKATKGDDGSYTLEYSLADLAAGVDYTVTETVLTDISGLSVDYEEIGSSCAVNGSETEFSDTVTINLVNAQNNRVDIENKYKPENSNLVVKNDITGNLGNKDKPFEYKVTITDTDGNTTTETFTLSGNEEKSISIPYGAKVEVEQADYTADGYSTYYTEGDDEAQQKSNKVTIEKQTDNVTIGFVNTRSTSVPTGKHNSVNADYFLIGLGTVAMMLMFIYKKRNCMTK